MLASAASWRCERILGYHAAMRRYLVSILCNLCLVACSDLTSTTPELANVGGQVTDSVTQKPIANALVAIYPGTTTAAWTTTQAGDPNYQYSTITDDTGTFGLSLPAGSYAVWVFAPGYHCGEFVATDATVATLVPDASTDVLPTVGDANFNTPRAIPTKPVTFSAQLQAANPKDPLSHQIFLMHPGTSLLISLDAPGPATDANTWPDGTWSTQFKAPTTVGDLNMTLVAATEGCLCTFLSRTLTIAR